MSQSVSTRTGYLWDPVFGWFDHGSGPMFPADPLAGIQPIASHISSPDIKRRLHELIEVSGLIGSLHRVPSRAASDEELQRVHTAAYVSRIHTDSELPKGGDAGDGISSFGRHGDRIAALAAGSTIAMTEAVLDGVVDHGFALVHPSGHHGLPDRGLGFVVFNNIAVAVRHIRATRDIGRIAIVDWDVHHGNGNQDQFAADPTVLTISIHQDNCFPPGSGSIDDRGTGPGAGYNINVPLPPGTGDDGYRYAADRVVAPALAAFRPELIIVACGFDANAMDPLARQLVTSAGFAALTRTVMDAARDTAHGRLVLVAEGGYSPIYVPFCGLATMQTLAGIHVLDDPLLPIVGAMGGHRLESHQQNVVDRAASFLADIAG
ncbi:class II histone deacetylase [Nocardia terpenica]|uniref:class II histone deacetylase n=1 Tax=Nocardia terpenica TaxID=455432 RepID=UPI002FE3A478